MAENNSSAPLKTAEGAYPALPAPDTHCHDEDTGRDVWSYSAAQMRAYAAQAVAAQAAPAAVAVPDEREAFEKWAAGQGINIRTDGGCYRAVVACASYEAWQTRAALAATPALPATEDSSAGDAKPIDMVLFCPACGLQHIDAPEWEDDPHDIEQGQIQSWKNEPHRSHLCHGCGHIWRPADVPTNGIQSVKTVGKADSPIATKAKAEVQAEPAALQMCSELRPRTDSEKAAYLAGVADGRMYAERDADTAPQAQPADALDAAPAAPINSEALQVIKALREWVMAVPADIAAALPAMPGIDANWMDAVEAALATHSAPADGLMVDMTPPATSRDRWMYNQGRLAEVERICAAIKTEDDYCVDQGDYMLDSDDCIKVARGTWLRPTFDRAAMAAAQEGGNASAGKDGAA